MAFSEALKKKVRKKSGGVCAVCHKPMVEIHHIKLQSENGEDTFENAIASEVSHFIDKKSLIFR